MRIVRDLTTLSYRDRDAYVQRGVSLHDSICTTGLNEFSLSGSIVTHINRYLPPTVTNSLSATIRTTLILSIYI